MLKNVGLKRRKGTFYFVPIVYLYFLFSLYILFDGKSSKFAVAR